MIWILLAVVLAVPTWLGITRSGPETYVRRWIGRCLIGGLAIGAMFSGAVWVGSVHVPTGANLLWGPLAGASTGAAVGLVTAAVWLVIVRLRRGKLGAPSVQSGVAADRRE